MKAWIPMGMAVLLASPAALASGVNGINGSMPNRISMNVTVPKQTQGATFGEKVNAGLHAAGSALAQGAALKIDIGCGDDACYIAFPDGDGVRADLVALRMAPLEASGKQALLGGALPGGAIVSAAVSSLAGQGGGAAAASYAATGRSAPVASQAAQAASSAPVAGMASRPIAAAPLPSRSVAPGTVDVIQPLADGDYLLTLVAQPRHGLRDTRKTQVRAAAPQVKVELVFSVRDGVLKTRHDTAKNSVSNIR